MPCIIMCGLPCSGKSTITKQIEKYLTEEKNLTVNIITDSIYNSDKSSIYADVQMEKQLRSILKSAVQKLLTTKEVLILDSLNYIKGFRYELYCAVKSCQTPQCVIYCDTDTDTIKEWNRGRTDIDKYYENTLEGLFARFEKPKITSRWDMPLITVTPDQTPPYDDIYNALYKSNILQTNKSTLTQAVTSTNYLHKLDSTIQQIIENIIEKQKYCVVGEEIIVEDCDKKIRLERMIKMGELYRTKRQFINYIKAHPVENEKAMKETFIEFINNSLVI